jgi:CRISPR-associated protein Cas2
MFVILVYDVHVKRVTKVLKTCRKYLHWVQNSVFEGKTTKAKLARLMSELKEIINDEEDSGCEPTYEGLQHKERT